jgi:hypothetical protein
MFIVCFLVCLPIFAGELYEMEDYLASTIGMNPYDGDWGSPVDTLGSPPSSDNFPSYPLSNDPIFDNGPSGSGSNNSGGGGNFNQFFGFNTTFSSWTNYGNRNQSNSETKDYLTQAILTNFGGLILFRRRGKYEKATFHGIEGIQAVSIFSRYIRKVWDKQIAVAKITRTFKIQGTRFDSCFDVSVNDFNIDNKNADMLMNSCLSMISNFMFCAC